MRNHDCGHKLIHIICRPNIYPEVSQRSIYLSRNIQDIYFSTTVSSRVVSNVTRYLKTRGFWSASIFRVLQYVHYWSGSSAVRLLDDITEYLPILKHQKLPHSVRHRRIPIPLWLVATHQVAAVWLAFRFPGDLPGPCYHLAK